jgi:hypothetical protein
MLGIDRSERVGWIVERYCYVGDRSRRIMQQSQQRFDNPDSRLGVLPEGSR